MLLRKAVDATQNIRRHASFRVGPKRHKGEDIAETGDRTCGYLLDFVLQSNLSNKWETEMMKLSLIGSVFAAVMLLMTAGDSFAAGGGLDKNSISTGNGTFAGQHIGARAERMKHKRLRRRIRR